MAKTKKSLYVMADQNFANATTLIGDSGQLDPADLGISYAGTTTGDDIVLPTEGLNEDLYVGPTAQQITIVTDTIVGEAFADGETLHVTLIDVTDGREKFPRRTFSGNTLGEIINVMNNAEIMAGDGRGIQCVVNNTTAADVTGIVITAANDVILKVAVNEEVATTITESTFSFHKGYTQDEAIAFAKDMATQIYGRTNRVGFPIVEPDFGAELTNASYSLVSVTKQTTRFDKNFGAGYIDQETVYILHASTAIAGWTLP